MFKIVIIRMALTCRWASAGASASNVDLPGGSQANASNLVSELPRTDPVTIIGVRPIDLGQSYETAVRGMYGNATFGERGYTALVNGQWVEGVADDVTVVNGRSTAVEAKYVLISVEPQWQVA